ncbi:CaiB/BaiF CoA transferase family protein [Oceanibacterium hippocampi]|uniref:Succinyl-CoA:(R)-benzylsuccinate CoA-transferase subunit BbsE n=1 Tax=Oceanibacterium hippocampi TaxID=745714 RepID=A0A1Y5TWG7_9PROT|nr:CoA transferase [Oceanibacterium hippocampi]SLN75364.1 Succinyl-CoA:(R)-benzylsuccinate CoA-transferase subunit BbsE [Oceanibacterium hippocampi]
MKLEGIRVLDLSQFLPGPMLTQMMGDQGAEIIKLEPPGEGEPVRRVGYRANGESVWFRNTHRGKKSIVLNLKDKTDREAFLALAKTADVLVEAFRPGVMDRLGIGYDDLRAINPGIVYVSISAFGQDGPDAQRPAHDIAIEALSGVVSLNLGADGKPTNPHMPVADMAGSYTALAGVLMALIGRQRTGQGDYIDISMQDSTMAWLPNVVGPVFAENRPPRVKEERSFGGYALYNTYETADDRYIVLGGVEKKFAVNLLTALERQDLIETACGAPGPGQDPVKEFLRATFRSRTRDDWEAWFAGKDICFAPVLDLHEAFHRDHVRHREMLLRDEDGNLHIGCPVKFRNEPAKLDFSLPRLGADTDHYAPRKIPGK